MVLVFVPEKGYCFYSFYLSGRAIIWQARVRSCRSKSLQCWKYFCLNKNKFTQQGIVIHKKIKNKTHISWAEKNAHRTLCFCFEEHLIIRVFSHFVWFSHFPNVGEINSLYRKNQNKESRKLLNNTTVVLLILYCEKLKK